MLSITEELSKELGEIGPLFATDTNERAKRLKSKIISEIPKLPHSQEPNSQTLQHSYNVYRQTHLMRLLSIFDGVCVTWNHENTMASIILTRAIMESIAVFHFFIERMEKHISNNNFDETFYWLMSNAMHTKMKFSSLQGYENLSLKNLHVMDAIRETDKKYQGKAEGLFKNYYDLLSELLHPNFLGVMDFFSSLHKETGKTYIHEKHHIKSESLFHILNGLGFLSIFEEDWDRSEKLFITLQNLGWSPTEKLQDMLWKTKS